jgi:hypothetical protein
MTTGSVLDAATRFARQTASVINAGAQHDRGSSHCNFYLGYSCLGMVLFDSKIIPIPTVQ